MEKCCMCRRAITTDEPLVIMIGKAGDEKRVCLECEKQMYILMESHNPDEVKSAINHLYTCSLSVEDEEVASFLTETIENNSFVFDSLVDQREKANPVDISQKRDYFAEKRSHKVEREESGWVTSLRILAWINLILGVIGGFVIANQLGTMTAGWGKNTNWGIFFITLIAICLFTFLTSAVIMVFLDMARDISTTKLYTASTQNDIVEIKKLLQNRISN